MIRGCGYRRVGSRLVEACCLSGLRDGVATLFQIGMRLGSLAERTLDRCDTLHVESA